MKIAIICGSAECLWADIEEYKKLMSGTGIAADIACINHTAIHFPKDFDLWISWHTELFEELMDQVQCSPTTIGPDDSITVDRMMTFPGFMASDSSLYAVKCLLEMGYDRIILCGVPLDNTRKFYDAPNAELPQHASSNIQKAWKDEARCFSDRVRSFSGNTRALLGAPTKEWLCL
jgi:hypothetical protein